MKPSRRVLNCWGRFLSRPFSEVCVSLLWSWLWEWGKKHLSKKEAKFVITGQFPSVCLPHRQWNRTDALWDVCRLAVTGRVWSGGKNRLPRWLRCREADLCGCPCRVPAPTHAVFRRPDLLSGIMMALWQMKEWQATHNCQTETKEERETKKKPPTLAKPLTATTKTQWRKMATTLENLY